MIIVLTWQNCNSVTQYIWQNVLINNVNVQNCNVVMSMLQLQFYNEKFTFENLSSISHRFNFIIRFGLAMILFQL
jgi:hypothetical protein